MTLKLFGDLASKLHKSLTFVKTVLVKETFLWLDNLQVTELMP